jgi:metal-sulfur cluster biosynthetic enzyme
MDNFALEKKIRESLSEIIDPETGLDILRMDLIHELSVEKDGIVSLIFRPSSPVCPMAYALGSSIKKKIDGIEDVQKVIVKVENFNKSEHLESLLGKTDSKRKD